MIKDNVSGRAVVAENGKGQFVLDRELYSEPWPFFERYAIVHGNGQGMASTARLEAAKDLIGAIEQ